MANPLGKFEVATRCLERGQLDDAERLCREVLKRDAKSVAALALAGSVELARGNAQAAIAWLTQAVQFAPNNTTLQVNLGEAYRRAGSLREALACLRHAITQEPMLAAAHFNFAMACADAELWSEAFAAFERALELQPNIDRAGAYKESLWRSKDWERTVTYHRRLFAQHPEQPSAQFELASALKAANLLDEAVARFERAHRMAPMHRNTLLQLAYTHIAIGQLDDAIATLDRAIKLHPDYWLAASCRLFLIQYHPDYDARAILREAAAWYDQHVAPLTIKVSPHKNERLTTKRLRIGYLSAHFIDHVSGLFTLPLLTHLDHDRFELFCYSTAQVSDSVTELHKMRAVAWRDVAALSDAEVAEAIRRDGIDILVDLSMHVAGGRPLILVHKPAPIQMCWLAYPGTTGLPTVDYRLSDPCLDPPSSDTSVYSEKTLRLPDCFWCYDPWVAGIEVAQLPCIEAGFVTFSCLNSPIKLNAPLLKLWGRVLGQVPKSRLLLRAPAGQARDWIRSTIESAGVDGERVDFVDRLPREEYFRCHARCDIGLDPFPYNGHTTSLDSFWMGVPVVTLLGKSVAGRAGASLALNLGLLELVANNPDEYVDKAVALAEDHERLRELRMGLRERMQNSPLMDAPRFARNMEALYRRAWHAYCREGTG